MLKVKDLQHLADSSRRDIGEGTTGIFEGLQVSICPKEAHCKSGDRDQQVRVLQDCF